jgi:hypothetical protein
MIKVKETEYIHNNLCCNCCVRCNHRNCESYGIVEKCEKHCMRSCCAIKNAKCVWDCKKLCCRNNNPKFAIYYDCVACQNLQCARHPEFKVLDLAGQLLYC